METLQPLQAGERLPFILLPSAPDGQSRQLRAPRGFSSVLVLLHATDCALCRSHVEQLSLLGAELQEWGAQVVAVWGDSLSNVTQWQKQMPAATGSSFTALADEEQRVAPQCGMRAPGLLVADQWGVLSVVQQASEDHQLLSPAEIVDWTRFIAIQCPECQAEAL